MNKITVILKQSKENLEKASKIISLGGAVIIPSEYGYAFACDYSNSFLIEELILIANSKAPVLIIVDQFETARTYGDIEPIDEIFAEKFMPGKLALAVPVRKKIRDSFCFTTTADGNLKHLVKMIHKPLAIIPLIDSEGRAVTISDELRNFFGYTNLILENGTLTEPHNPTILSLHPSLQIHKEGALSKKEIVDFIKTLEERHC